MAKSLLRSPIQLAILLLPQLVILILFIVSRASVWNAIWDGATSASSFFFEVVSAGAGWAMFSLGTLAASLAFQLPHLFGFAEEVTKGFPRLDGERFVSELSRAERSYERFGTACAVLTFGFVVGGFLSVCGAGAYYGDPSIAQVSWPVLGGLLAAGVANLMVDNSDVGLTSTVRLGLCDVAWSAENTYAWKQLLRSGRLNHPDVHAVVQEKLERVLKDEKLARAVQKLASQQDKS